jgi:pimeloyl-ACP methyl ester carboxylesterase
MATELKLTALELVDGKGPALEYLSIKPSLKKNHSLELKKCHIVMLHGAYTDAWSWAETFMPYFAGLGVSCTSLSLRGHGKSDGRQMLDLWGLIDFEYDFERFLRHLISQEIPKDKQIVLMGSSMGGLLTQRILARKLPWLAERMHAAVLVGSVPATGLGAAMLKMMWQSPRLFAELVTVGLTGQPNPKFMELLAVDPLRKKDHSLTYSHVFKESARALSELAIAPWPALIAMPQMKPDLGGLPVLGVHGALDKMVPIENLAFLPTTETAILTNMGHIPMIESQWQQAAARIETFLMQINENLTTPAKTRVPSQNKRKPRAGKIPV